MGSEDGETAEEQIERAEAKFEEMKKNMPPPEEMDRRVAERMRIRRSNENADIRIRKLREERFKKTTKGMLSCFWPRVSLLAAVLQVAKLLGLSFKLHCTLFIKDQSHVIGHFTRNRSQLYF